jgi:hypothetical protein
VPYRFEHDSHYPANIFLVVNDQYSHRATCLLRLHDNHDNAMSPERRSGFSAEYRSASPKIRVHPAFVLLRRGKPCHPPSQYCYGGQVRG